jgi:hypothetical protein
MTHLHIAFAGVPGAIGLVVKDEAFREIARERIELSGQAPYAETSSVFPQWEAAIVAIQRAAALGAYRITLYSHYDDVMTLLELKPHDHRREYKQWDKGRVRGSTLDPAYGDDGSWGIRTTMWQALFGAFAGRWAASRIPEARNAAVEVARGEGTA